MDIIKAISTASAEDTTRIIKAAAARMVELESTKDTEPAEIPEESTESTEGENLKRFIRASEQFEKWHEVNPNKGAFSLKEFLAIHRAINSNPWRGLNLAINGAFYMGYKCGKRTQKPQK